MYLCISIYTILEIWGEEKYMHVNGVTGKGELNLHLSKKSMDNMQHGKKIALYLSYLEHQKKLFLWQVGFGDEMGSCKSLLSLS